MNEFIGWTDYLDEEKIRTNGEFMLYRNYIGANKQYLFSTHCHKIKTKNKGYLFNKRPIAKGVTAYFSCEFNNLGCLSSLIRKKKKFDSHDLFIEYLKIKFNPVLRANQTKVRPLGKKNLWSYFLTNHYDEEKQNLKESSKFYNEVLNEKDKNLKKKVREYAEAYLDWLNVFMTEINERKAKKDNKNKKGSKPKRQYDPNLHLSDVLRENISQDKVISLYHSIKGEGTHMKTLTMFLRDLQNKGYYKRKVFLKELEYIGKNDIDKDFVLRREFKPPLKNEESYNSPPFSNIPEADNLE